jgi:ubiquinone/menaquinone biosynthesis C-methylase UbiE
MEIRQNQISRVTRSRAKAKSSYDRMSRWYDLLSGSSEQAACRQGLRMLMVMTGEIILEIGFGTGRNLVALANATGETGYIYGIDLSEGMLKVAQSRIEQAGLAKRIELRGGDAVDLPYETGLFDAIFCAFTLELFDTPEIPLVLQECRRVLKAGGRVGIVSLARYGKPNAVTRLYEWAHLKFPSVIDCRPIYASQSLVAAGFAVQQVIHHSMWGLPVEVAVGIKPNEDRQ